MDAQSNAAESLIIAIDGPAASGKSTLAKSLAEQLDYLYFDTGALYRAVTLAVLQRGVDIEDEEAITKLAGEVTIDLLPAGKEDGRLYDVTMDGEDCTWAIRSHNVDANVSKVSAYSGVRRALNTQQRRIGLRGGVVMAGRDIGTVVLPEAHLKLYLEAALEERASRRYEEMLAHGEKPDLREVEESLRQRDQIDTNRAVAPLRAAEDAIILFSDGKQPEDVLAEALILFENKKSEMKEEAVDRNAG